MVLIEDNPADAGLVRRAIEHHEIECELVLLNDGEKAVRFVEAADPRNCPDLVIIDLNLPRRSGFEVLEALRKNSECAQSRVLILSSSDTKTDRDTAACLGANAYLRKPTRLADFMGIGAIVKDFLKPVQQ